ncbi:MAG TPA: hypothetical protein VKU19_06545 [Bryobacteraceae bacterium]|nr:hypothetical protein [Bryobacteraceae bacterium]
MERSLQSLGCKSFILSLIALSLPALAQNGGRFEEAKRMAVSYLDSNQYDRAAGKLEEVWEQDQTDPAVAEYLGIAYLNGDDRRYNAAIEGKAQKALEQAIKLGGKATFLVRHPHGGIIGRVSGGDALDYCAGKLSISPGRVVFVMKALKGAEDHSFELKTSDILKINTPNAEGKFTIKTKPKNYPFQPQTKNKADSDLLLSLIREHLGVGTQ